MWLLVCGGASYPVPRGGIAGTLLTPSQMEPFRVLHAALRVHPILTASGCTGVPKPSFQRLLPCQWAGDRKSIFLPGSPTPPSRRGSFPIPCRHHPRPVPVCVSARMLPYTPELGRRPVRQADVTESHSQTWKPLIQWGLQSHLFPWAPLGQGSPAGSRQLAALSPKKSHECHAPCSAQCPGQQGTPSPRPGLRDAASARTAHPASRLWAGVPRQPPRVCRHLF